MSLVDRIWRLSMTGLAFLCIFFGGGVLAMCLKPILAIFPGDRRRRTKWTIHRLFRLYLLGLRVGGLLRLQIVGACALDRAAGHILVANHPSLLDVVILMSLVPRAQCIVKHQLWQHRFLGPLMRQAGYISNALDPQEMVAACTASLVAGETLIIFPEGTRSIPGAKPVLQRGFAHLATLTEAPILPVTITCDPPTLVKGEPWWRIPTRAPLFRLVVGESVQMSEFLVDSNRTLATRRIVRYFSAYYESRISNV
jgi:1-acyl-sn-glycerol-3-phosphate acyltransferase